MKHSFEISATANPTPAARFAPTDLLPRAGRPLLANQPARPPVLDVQHRQPDPRNGSFPGEAPCDPARRNLDASGFGGLVCLRRARVGRVSQFNSRARRRDHRGDDRAKTLWNGSHCLALGSWLVSRGPTRIPILHAAGTQRKSRAHCATRMGTNVSVVLDVLVGAYCDNDR